jgi:hypothetical protein
VKRNTTVARVTEADAGLERIKHLAQQLAPAPVNSHQHRRLSAAIRVEADAYRKSLDADQATATHDGKLAAVGRGSFNGTFASRTASLVAHPGIHSRKHSAPRAEHKTVPMPVVARRVRVPADTSAEACGEEKPDETKER